MKTYKSKVDVWLAILVFLPLGYAFYETFLKEEWSQLLVLSSVILCVIYVFNSVEYRIENNILSVKIGFLLFRRVNINEVLKVEKTNNPLSAPALSLQRLEIVYAKGHLLISPKERENFINELLRINPNIQVQL